jgi:hypothetical protein
VSEHPREHEELLADLLSGERRPAEAEVAERLRECSACREQWARLRDTAAHVGRAGAAQRAALAELEAGGPAADEELVRAALGRLAGEAAPAPRPRRRVLAWLAAAAVLAVGLWLARGFLARPDERVWLGDGAFRGLAPSGEVASFERFSWEYTGPAADSFTLRVFALADGERGARILVKERLKETNWTPTAQERETLPGRILWEVDALDEFRSVLSSASARASR